MWNNPREKFALDRACAEIVSGTIMRRPVFQVAPPVVSAKDPWIFPDENNRGCGNAANVATNILSTGSPPCVRRKDRAAV
jgi:hypothetical protein